MRTHDDTALSADVVRLVHARAGNPAEQRRPVDNGPALDAMRVAALEVAREALRLADRLSGMVAACDGQGCAWCGARLVVRETGRTREYCDDRCRKASGRARPAGVEVPRETPEPLPTL